jgi:hypothetical protein
LPDTATNVRDVQRCRGGKRLQLEELLLPPRQSPSHLYPQRDHEKKKLKLMKRDSHTGPPSRSALQRSIRSSSSMYHHHLAYTPLAFTAQVNYSRAEATPAFIQSGNLHSLAGNRRYSIKIAALPACRLPPFPPLLLLRSHPVRA